MSESLFQATPLQEAFNALRRDLIHEEGPRISTMRNYRFAILVYNPKEEFKLRAGVQRLSRDLEAHGWLVVTLDLQQLLLDRVRSQEGQGQAGQGRGEWGERVIEMECRMAKLDRSRGLGYVKSKLTPLIEGVDGIAADCSRIIREHAKRHPDKADRMVALVGRAGALYPFFRSSALLRHLDGRTDNVPVVLLYPGERRGHTALSFMGMLEPDSDYRPRIYG